MSVPTTVFENGQWVTRNIDPWTLLAQNRARQEEEMGPVAEPSKPPTIALLTQTLVRSPALKWILPAMIRPTENNDVLLISQEAVRIKEAFQGYPMASVHTKDDFDAPIRNAKVLGEPVNSSPDYSTKITPLSARDEAPRAYKVKAEDSMSAVIEDGHPTVLKSEHTDSGPLNAHPMLERTATRATHGKHEPKERLPAQFLILILENCQIVFLYSTSCSSTQHHFVTSQRALPKSDKRLFQVGEHLAIDPRSRALAVGAQEGDICLYSLKSRRQLELEFAECTPFMPIEAERRLAVDGIILHLEFLHPEESDNEHVLILLVVSKHGKSKLVWYEWDTRTKLHDAQMKPNFYALPKEDYLPLFLIPLKAYNAFVIVTNSRISVYKHILTGTPIEHNLQLRYREEPEEPASSKNPPLWIQWARPVRYRAAVGYQSQARQTNDNIYLCREDGVVLFLDIKNSLSHMIESHHNAGKLGATINEAFAVIDLGPHANDLLVAGGDSGYGGLWQFSPRAVAEQTFPLLNWSPLVDVICSPPSINPQEGSSSPKSRPSDETDYSGCATGSSLIACTGKGKHSSVCELQLGRQANLLESFDLGDGLESTIMDAWTMFPSRDLSLILVAHATNSSLIWSFKDDTPKLLGSHEALILGSRTIVAADLPSGRQCQVTDLLASCYTFQATWSQIDQEYILEGELHWQHDFGEIGAEVSVACVESFDHESYLAVALVREKYHFVQIGSLGTKEGFLCEEFLVTGHPTCIAMKCSQWGTTVAVGNASGTVELFTKDREGPEEERFHRVDQWEFGGFQVCDSMAILTEDESGSDPPKYLLLCGLRNGQLHTLCLKQGFWDISLVEQVAVGRTSMQIKRTASASKGAFIRCDNNLYTLHYTQRQGYTSPGMLRAVCVASSYQTVGAQRDVLAFAGPRASHESPNPKAHSLVTISQREAQFLIFDSSRFEISPRRPDFDFPNSTPINVLHSSEYDNADLELIPGRWDVSGTPVRVLHSKQLKKLVVLTSEVRVVRPCQHNGLRRQAGKRRAQFAVVFLELDETAEDKDAHADADAMDVDQSDDKQKKQQSQTLNTRHGERILGMKEWFPKINDMTYHLLLFNTIIRDAHKASSGRLLFYSVTRAEDGALTLSPKKTIDTSPVIAVTPHPNGSSLLYCSGNDLNILALEPSPAGLKFGTPCRSNMRSAGRHVTVLGRYICVSTANDSFQIYVYEDGQLYHHNGHTESRHGLCHLAMPAWNIWIATDMYGFVTGLWDPPVTQANNSLVTVFEGRMTRSLTRLFPIKYPGAKRDVFLPGAPITLCNAGPVSLGTLKSEAAPATVDQRSNAVIGTSPDGGITQLLVMTDGSQLLKFVHNMCERHPTVCPFKSQRWPKRPLEPSTDRPELMHINGDILKRLIERDAVPLLTSMLNKDVPPPESNERFWDFETAEARWEYFLEHCEGVLGQKFCRDSSREKIVAEVARWIEYMLRSAM